MGFLIVDDTTEDNEFDVIDTSVNKNIILPTEDEKSTYTPKTPAKISFFEMDPSKFSEDYVGGYSGYSGASRDKFYEVFYKLFCRGCIQLNILDVEKVDDSLKGFLRPKMWFK